MKRLEWVALLLCGCALGSGKDAPNDVVLQAGCLAELGVAPPAIDEAPGDLTDQQKALEAQAECITAIGDASRCDASRVLVREAALCAAIQSGADPLRQPWRLSIVFIERFGGLVWGIQVPRATSSRDNFKLDAFNGDLLDITVSSTTD